MASARSMPKKAWVTSLVFAVRSISAKASGGTTAWLIDLANGRLTIGDINASSIKAGTLDCDNVTVKNLKATSISGPNTYPVSGTFTCYRYVENAGLTIEESCSITVTNGIITEWTGYT